MAFAIEITGTNAVAAWATTDTQSFSAFPSHATGAGWVTVGDAPSEYESAPRAQFATRAEARAVALACHWNNQRFEVKRIRGGGVNASAEGKITSCQEFYGR